MTDKPIGAILADMLSDPGEPATPAGPTATTGEVLQSMLTENTGRHILDSGGAYGRNWERNQGVDFDASPEATLRTQAYEHKGEMHVSFDATVDVYHWLKDRLEYVPEIQAEWEAFAEADDDGTWSLATAEAFAESRGGTGIYGDSAGPITVNTYNHESVLSQVLQYVAWQDGDDQDEPDRPLVLLAIHGGCDVRGGYTDYRVFEVLGMEGIVGILDDDRVSIACDHHTDDGEFCGAYWEIIGSMEDHHGDHHEGLDDYVIERCETIDAGKVGTIIVADDGSATCPVCGQGRLTAYPPTCG